MHKPDFIIGVDLGQARDFTAITVLERSFVDSGRKLEIEMPYSHPPRYEPIYEHHYAARHLERLPLGTSYPAQVARTRALVNQVKERSESAPFLVVDQTGVGRPVVDMLKAADLNPVSVTITGGDTVSREYMNFRVPKRDLVSTAQVLLQSERLKIARGLPEAQTLIDELLAFKVSISLKGHDSYGNDQGQWRENPHDDLVLALALACWYGETQPPLVYEEAVPSEGWVA